MVRICEALAEMKLGVLRETAPDETRVALIPAHVASLTNPKVGFSVLVEAGAGVAAGFSDADYTQSGAQVVSSRSSIFDESEVIVGVRVAGANTGSNASAWNIVRKGQSIVGFLDPLGQPTVLAELASTGANFFAMELIPRISRAQSMDALSSMATVSGYKAVLLAANHLPRLFPMMMTAAGTITAARVLVIGAGVAGLQAIAVARKLGAVVSGYDVRPAAREQIQSLGAKFVDIGTAGDAEGAGGYAKAFDEAFYQRQREALRTAVADSDVVITTAAVPGAKSPVLVTREMIEGMRPGSVVVDLAAERGGNCEPTQADREVKVGTVLVLGPTNLPATIPFHASQMYSKNIVNLITHLKKVEALGLGETAPTDEIAAGALTTRGGSVVHPAVLNKLNPTTPPAAAGATSGA